MSNIESRLDAIRMACLDAKSRINEILERDERIEIATIKTETFADDLYRLMKDMAETANPVLNEMGLSKEAITHDIKEFVDVLADNNHELYFASVNLDAKYAKNKYALINLNRWFDSLIHSIEKLEAFIDTETEKHELGTLFAKIDRTNLGEKEKEELKKEFLATLNRLNL
jgi:hypothetical protein